MCAAGSNRAGPDGDLSVVTLGAGLAMGLGLGLLLALALVAMLFASLFWDLIPVVLEAAILLVPCVSLATALVLRGAPRWDGRCPRCQKRLVAIGAASALRCGSCREPLPIGAARPSERAVAIEASTSSAAAALAALERRFRLPKTALGFLLVAAIALGYAAFSSGEWLLARRAGVRFASAPRSAALLPPSSAPPSERVPTAARVARTRSSGNRFIRHHAELLLDDGATAEVELIGAARSWKLAPGEAIHAELFERHIVSIARGGASARTPEHPAELESDAAFRGFLSAALTLATLIAAAVSALRARRAKPAPSRPRRR
jgi:hypothetical protein